VSPPEIPSAPTGSPCRSLAKRGEVCVRIQDKNVDRLQFIGFTRILREDSFDGIYRIDRILKKRHHGRGGLGERDSIRGQEGRVTVDGEVRAVHSTDCSVGLWFAPLIAGSRVAIHRSR